MNSVERTVLAQRRMSMKPSGEVVRPADADTEPSDTYKSLTSLQCNRMEIWKYQLVHQCLSHDIRYEPFNLAHIPQDMSITMSNLTINPHFRE